MRFSRTLICATALGVLASTSLAADEQATVLEQVQQERTQALDRLSRIRQRLNTMQTQLEQLNVEEIVKRRLEQGSKRSGAGTDPNIHKEDASATEMKRDVTALLTGDPLSFSSGTTDLSNLTRLAFDTKRRFFESRGALKNVEKLFAQKIVTRPELQEAQIEHSLATEAINGFQSQISRTLQSRQQMLDVLVQARSNAENQVAFSLAMRNAGRGTDAPILEAKRILLQLEQQGIHLKEVIDQLGELHKILQDRDEEGATTELPSKPVEKQKDNAH